MTELKTLVDGPGASSLPYVDPAFPDRPLVLHAARPREYDAGTPVLFVHHGVGRNGEDYRDYWLDLVDEAGVLAISIEFSEASFPEYLWYHFGNLHNKDGVPNPREAWTFGIDERLFQQLRAQGVTTRQRFSHQSLSPLGACQDITAIEPMRNFGRRSSNAPSTRPSPRPIRV